MQAQQVEVSFMRFKPRGEWHWIQPEPTPLSPTLRPPVPTWAEWVSPLPREKPPAPGLRRSALGWKEFPFFPPQEGAEGLLTSLRGPAVHRGREV